MHNPQHKQCSHGIVQHFTIRAIQLGNSRQGERKRHALEEVGMGARVKQKRVRIAVRGLRCRVVRVVAIADVLFFLDTTVDDPVREVDKIGRERESPSPGDGCEGCCQ